MTTGAKQHVSIKVYGQVQGVFFRVSAKIRADELAITGFAKNLDDGSVGIEAEGSKPRLLEFIEWCKKGPPLAVVERVEISWKEHPAGYRTFEVT